MKPQNLQLEVKNFQETRCRLIKLHPHLLLQLLLWLFSCKLLAMYIKKNYINEMYTNNMNVICKHDLTPMSLCSVRYLRMQHNNLTYIFSDNYISPLQKHGNDPQESHLPGGQISNIYFFSQFSATFSGCKDITSSFKVFMTSSKVTTLLDS